MNCAQAAALLNKIQLGEAPDGGESGLVSILEEGGYLAEVKGGAFDREEYSRLRNELAGLIRNREAQRVLPGTPPPMELELRRRILDLSVAGAALDGSVTVGGRSLSVTYKGRTLLSSLAPRLARVESMDVAVFEKRLADLRRSFGARSAKAAEILKVISPALKNVDEIHLRSAAVGLAARSEPAEALAQGYLAAVEALKHEILPIVKQPLLAECIIAAKGPLSAEAAGAEGRAIAQLKDYVVKDMPWAMPDDALTAASVLYPLEQSRRDEVMKLALAFLQSVQGAGGVMPQTALAWILVASNGLPYNEHSIEWITKMRDELFAQSVPPADAEMAAAVLASTRRETGVDLIQQFHVARSYLTRLSQGEMAVPAAMLAVLATGIDESLDDLRIASSEVSLNKLSLGGVENLSLGLKLLMQTAVLATEPGSATHSLQVGPDDAAAFKEIGLPGLAMVIPAALAAFASFHEVTLHQLAVSDYTFHPVHTHYIYG